MSGDYADKELYLYVWLPIQYDSDSSEVDYFLDQANFGPVTEANIDDAIDLCRRQFEKELWADNVGKQLLGRLLDNDLGGDDPPDGPE